MSLDLYYKAANGLSKVMPSGENVRDLHNHSRRACCFHLWNDFCEYQVHFESEAEEWAEYNAEQTTNTIGMVVGSAIILIGLYASFKSGTQQREQTEKIASDNRIRELEEKVRKLEEQKPKE